MSKKKQKGATISKMDKKEQKGAIRSKKEHIQKKKPKDGPDRTSS